MTKATGRAALRAAPPPDTDGRWIVPRGVAALLEELDLCGVPVDAVPAEARRVLDLNGVWVPDIRLSVALRTRRSRTQVQDLRLAA